MRDKIKQAAYNKEWKAKNADRKKELDKLSYERSKPKRIARAISWNKTNKEARRNITKKYESKRNRREEYLQRTYGLTASQYDLLKENQNSRCFICDEQHERLVVDHCHSTGMVRGLLCTCCNAGLGQFRDNIKLLKNAIIHLEKNGLTC